MNQQWVEISWVFEDEEGNSWVVNLWVFEQQYQKKKSSGISKNSREEEDRAVTILKMNNED